ncbi:MAG: 2-C-methyl-D-erythritol 4-phosphate cytidylyltransferase [Bacilli bacterium]|jgi:2-C-methyl-D-erythritol 4-phosphate cytidylyltransferase/2-C-methyl-D-erythritol 2,4-cyclodiphosphate synthase
MFDVILLMAGSSKRLNLGINKNLIEVLNKPIFMYSLEAFLNFKECNQIYLVCRDFEEEIVSKYIKDIPKVKLVIGGEERQDSLYNGLKSVTAPYVLVHDAARPNVTLESIKNIMQVIKKGEIASLAVKSKDTIKEIEEDYITKNLVRKKLWSMQTPQGGPTKVYKDAFERALKENFSATDDTEILMVYSKEKVKIVEGTYNNYKITDQEDLQMFIKEKTMYRIGHSKDIHRLVKDRPLILGGIKIPHSKGLFGHSDADCVLHSVAEAIIGALGKGDIGMMFPDTDSKYKDIASSYFVLEVKKLMENEGYKINNLDLIIYLENPILKDYKALIKENIAKLLECDSSLINIKATRNEMLDAIGKEEGIASECVVMLIKK